MIEFIVIGVIGYLVGSIPTGFWISRWRGIEDITQHGSGNIGATNVSRVLGKQYFFLVFFLDALKAYVIMQAVSSWYGMYTAAMMVAWFSVLVGNSYSIFLRGRGGKGVATVFGLLGAVAPYIMLISMGIWLVILLIVRNAACASLTAMTLVPLWVCIAGEPSSFVVCCSITTIWLWWRHYENIMRMVTSHYGHARPGA